MNIKIGIILLVVLLFILIIGGKNRLEATNLFDKNQGYKNITTDDVRELLDKGEKIVLLDVRESYEYRQSNIKGSTLIPLGSLQNNLEILDKNDKIIVICRSGNRSVTASKILINNGFNNVYNMVGGMLNWEN
jgi:phage shock protein E